MSVLHLVRRSGERPPDAVVRPDDQLVVLDETPAEQILDLLERADVAVLWGPATYGAIAAIPDTTRQ